MSRPDERYGCGDGCGCDIDALTDPEEQEDEE